MAAEWARVRELLEQALQLEPSARAAFVAAACGDDEKLRRELESLLAAESASAELSRFAAAAVARAAEDAAKARSGPDVRPGTRIGSYRVRRELGSGGMGVVYEAEQTHPARVVALKTLRIGIAGVEARRRFHYEAEALARLQHPNVAQVFEAGIHGENEDGTGGFPYFSMELVQDARTLTEFARERNLSIGDRLVLFAVVCDAVHYGHQRGVIHRDLKPGNVLVDPNGNPKVIDYGVARVGEEERSLRTAAGELVGTLLYMSPEQLRGDHDADVRIDVYALGAVLHELLCGAPLFDVKGKPVAAAVSHLTSAQPRRPSAVDGRVPRDLDWIVLKAVNRDRDRRYRSASDLAADVRRYLDHEALEAGPPSAVYRARTFARRHRGALAATAAIVLALAIGLFQATRARQDAERARDVAATEAARANETLRFVQGLFNAVRADSGRRDARVKDVLDAAAARIDSEPAGQPLVEAAVRGMIGDCYLSLDDVPAAARQLERAVAIRRELQGDGHVETLRARIGLGNVRSRQGRRAEAEAEFRAAADGLPAVAGAQDVDVLVARSAHATALEQLGRIADAEAEHRRAMDLAAERFEGTDEQSMVETQFVNTLMAAGKLPEALEVSHRALERCNARVGGNQLIRLRVRLVAAARVAALDPHGAAEELERIYADATRALGPKHAMTIQALQEQGKAMLAAGDVEGAERSLRDALDRQRDVDGEEAWTTANGRVALARVLEAAGRFDEEEALLRDAFARARAGLGDADPDVLAVRQELATFLYRRQRWTEAETEERAILGASLASAGASAPETATATLGLGAILEAEGRLDDAVDLLRPLVEACRRDLGPDHDTTVIATGNLGACLFLSRRYAEAIPVLEEALAAFTRRGNSESATRAITHDLEIARREAATVGPPSGKEGG